MPAYFKSGYFKPTFIIIIDSNLKVIENWFNEESSDPEYQKILLSFTKESILRAK